MRLSRSGIFDRLWATSFNCAVANSLNIKKLPYIYYYIYYYLYYIIIYIYIYNIYYTILVKIYK